MQSKDLNIFVYDLILATDSIIRRIKYIVKKVISFFKYAVFILSNGVIGFSIDINSPPDNVISIPERLPITSPQKNLFLFNKPLVYSFIDEAY